MIGLLLAATMLAAATVPPSPPPVRAGEATVTGRAVIADGHVDVGARFVAGDWTIQIRDDTVQPSVWRDPSDVVLQAVDAARMAVPADERFAFLGTAGAPVWVLPQAQRNGVLWPGWNTQDPEVATTIDRNVTWTLHDVTGPGRFTLFLTGNFGQPQVLFDGTKPMPQRTGIEVNSHAHGNWAFTAPGTYLLDVAMTGTTTEGRTVTDRDTLRIFVGAGDPATALGPERTATTPGTAQDTAEPEPPPTGRALWWAGGGTAVAVLAGGLVVWRRRRSPATGPEEF